MLDILVVKLGGPSSYRNQVGTIVTEIPYTLKEVNSVTYVPQLIPTMFCPNETPPHLGGREG